LWPPLAYARGSVGSVVVFGFGARVFGFGACVFGFGVRIEPGWWRGHIAEHRLGSGRGGFGSRRAFCQSAQPFVPKRVQNTVGALAALEQDAQLMLQVKEGDAGSFELLLNKYRRPLVSYLHRMVQNQAVAEELAQEVFLRVYRARGTYEPAAKFTTWLFRIATHLALNSLRDARHQRREQSVDAAGPDDQPLQLADRRANREEQLIAEARLAAVRQAIAALPEKQRAAVLLHKYEAMDYAQIADALGCTVSAVKSLLFRAYESLRVSLAYLAENHKKRPVEDVAGG
jgi:RNA polymerase sigma-70 factor, ECF subfamily